MNKYLYPILCSIFCFSAPLLALNVDQTNQITEQSISLNGVRITTFNMKQTVNFTMKYRMDTQDRQISYTELQDTIISFFNAYDGQRDFWELINEKLILHVFETYPFLSFLETEIQVLPGRTFPYLRSSVAKLENGKITNSFVFEYNPEIVQNSFSGACLKINYSFIENISPNEYLDFVDLKNEIDLFLISQEIDLRKWTTQKEQLKKHLKEVFPVLSNMEIRIIS